MEKKPESIFINRELSWLDFDSRVLALAKEKTVPLGERIKFAAIFGSNMDEFFMVRVGSLYDQTLLKNNKTDNVTHMTAAEQIAAITPRVAELRANAINTSSTLSRRWRRRATKGRLRQARQAAGAFLENLFPARAAAAAQPADRRFPPPVPVPEQQGHLLYCPAPLQK